jgi:Ca-activated chloride channel family protein
MNKDRILRLAIAAALAAVASVTFATTARAQSGVLIPSSVSDTPDPSVLELTEMTVNVTVDRQLAHTRVMQIFANRTDSPVEGTYVFAVPTTASIADFAVWDGDTRIPGVILEKRQAKDIYETLAAQAIDPGLLEQEDEEEATTAFTVKVAPVPAYGTKRLEIEYTELLPVDEMQSYYSLPLKPSEYGEQEIGHLRIDVLVLSGFPLTGLDVRGNQFPVAVDRDEQNAKGVHFEGTHVRPAQDFAFVYGVAVPKSRLDVVAYRAPERISPDELRDPALAERQPDGYFQATAVFNSDGRAPGAARTDDRPRSVLVMLDTSLSMSGEKLDRAYEAVQYFLGALTPRDRFDVLLFNDDVMALGAEPVAGTPDQIERALGFVRAGYLTGGTDLEAALDRGLEAASRLPNADGGRAIVLVTDGNPTLSTTQTKRILERFKKANDAGPRARLDVFGIGSDTRVGLLGELARASRGLFVWSRETDDLEFKLKAFFGKVGRAPIDDLRLTVDGGDVYQVYPDDAAVGYDGSAVHWLGRYRKPGRATFNLRGTSEAGAVALDAALDLPERDDTHAEVPRLWARARVDYLLAQIDLNGETDEAINEIIALSKRYKFVTPYTSFLAAPRSLLRPRTIRPGDPVLRVQTDPTIRSVVAVFPFGLVKPMRYLDDEKVWETRFLAPVGMDDGEYACRLVMTDAAGRSYEEVKRFRIDSRPPRLAARVEPATARAGDEVTISVAADRDARWLAARLYGAAPVRVRWDAAAKTNVGRLRIPADLPPGVYTVEVTGEDLARNGASTSVRLEVLSR